MGQIFKLKSNNNKNKKQMKKFLKSADLQLINGGYLTDKSENPITNKEFIALQRHAEYIVTFAKLAEGKDFKGKKADSLEELRWEVTRELATKAKSYITKPTEVKKDLTKQLADEAMAFMKFEEESSKVEKMNLFLQQFNTLSDFEEFGLFFEDGIVKLNKIYTMTEIISSVEKTIDLL